MSLKSEGQEEGQEEIAHLLIPGSNNEDERNSNEMNETTLRVATSSGARSGEPSALAHTTGEATAAAGMHQHQAMPIQNQQLATLAHQLQLQQARTRAPQPNTQDGSQLIQQLLSSSAQSLPGTQHQQARTQAPPSNTQDGSQLIQQLLSSNAQSLPGTQHQEHAAIPSLLQSAGAPALLGQQLQPGLLAKLISSPPSQAPRMPAATTLQQDSLINQLASGASAQTNINQLLQHLLSTGTSGHQGSSLPSMCTAPQNQNAQPRAQAIHDVLRGNTAFTAQNNVNAASPNQMGQLLQSMMANTGSNTLASNPGPTAQGQTLIDFLAAQNHTTTAPSNQMLQNLVVTTNNLPFNQPNQKGHFANNLTSNQNASNSTSFHSNQMGQLLQNMMATTTNDSNSSQGDNNSSAVSSNQIGQLLQNMLATTNNQVISNRVATDQILAQAVNAKTADGHTLNAGGPAAGEVRETRWSQRYRELVEFQQSNGHCRVPQKYAKNKKLAWWVMNQRSQYTKLKKGEASWLTEERVAALDAIGFTWTPYNRRKTSSKKVSEEDKGNATK